MPLEPLYLDDPAENEQWILATCSECGYIKTFHKCGDYDASWIMTVVVVLLIITFMILTILMLGIIR